MNVTVSIILFGVVALIIVLFFSKTLRDEGFEKMSADTASRASHTPPPPPQEDDGQHVVATGREVENEIQKNLMERDVMSMTEGPNMAVDADGSYAAA